MSISFADLGVPHALVRRLEARGILEPFPIQEAALPNTMAGKDVVGKAPTGSGKTLAFGLALVARTGRAAPRRPQGLVLVPTRELAAQVQKELGQLTQDRGRRIICIYGGTSYNVARKALSSGVDIVVACPGRLEDMLEQRALDLSDVTTVVVDEADRMADMGFLPAVRRILSMTPANRHVMLFSATMGPDVNSLVREFTRDAAIHDVVGEEAPSDVEHFFWRVPREQRAEICAQIAQKYERAIVFTRTKHGADRLARQLVDRGVSAVPIHGDRTQAQREKALRSVQNGSIRILVATDVAARGIHIESLPCVVHFDPPTQATDYLHRSGRTGRAGQTGTVISLVGEDVIGHVKRMQKVLGVPVGLDVPDTASAQHLGVINDADAAERLDGSLAQKTPAPRVSRDSDRRDGARTERHRFERRDGDRVERSRTDRTSAPRADRNDRVRPERHEIRPRTVARPERGTNFERESRSNSFTRSSKAPSDAVAVVSFFNESKGYGFAVDDKGQDLFIHFSNIAGDGFRTLEAGQKVAYELAKGPKGLEARNVRVVNRGGRRHYPGHYGEPLGSN